MSDTQTDTYPFGLDVEPVGESGSLFQWSIRKHGKLPGQTLGQNYALEYGVDTIEIHADVLGPGDRVLLIDDLIATGGTAVAAVALLRRTGASCAHAGFVIDLFDLGGAEKLRALEVEVFKLIDFEGH